MKSALKNRVGPSEVRRLVYSKYLILQGKKYLENDTVEHYFNLSIVLFANATEMLCQTISLCHEGTDRSYDHISVVLKSLNKLLPNFPFSEFDKITKARNSIYHGAVLHTYNTCRGMEDLVERSFRQTVSDYLHLNYETISLTDLIKDSNIQKPLAAAETCLAQDNYTEAIISACEAFAILEGRLHERGRSQIDDFHPAFLRGTEISWRNLSRTLIGSNPKKPNITSELSLLSNQVEEKVNQKIINLARKFDLLLMFASSYEDFKHFESLRPIYSVSMDGSFHCDRRHAELRKYGKKEADFVFQFVLSSVMNIQSRLRPIELRNFAGDVIRIIE